MPIQPKPPRHRLPFAPAHHCWSCGAAIDAHQAVGGGGVCRRFECRTAEVRRQQAESRALEARRGDRARERLRAEGVEPEAVSWSVTPSNDAGPVPLRDERREAFLSHLDRVVREAVGEEAGQAGGAGVDRAGGSGEGGEPPGTAAVQEAEARLPGAPQGGDGRFGPPTSAEARALAAGCATCRGWCCRQGGTHAFLDAGSIRRVLGEHPDLEPDALPRLYAGYLGEEHLRGGCVFQGEGGCRLPREIRSDTCNIWFCPDLVDVRRAWRKKKHAGVHRFVAVSPGGDRAERVGRVGAAVREIREEPGEGDV